MRLTLVVALLVLSSLCSLASDKVQIAPEPGWIGTVRPDPDRQPDPDYVNKGYYFGTFNRQINVAHQTSYTCFTRQIVNEAGVQYGSEISVSFSPAYQQVFFHKINIIRDGEVISLLNAKDIQVIQEEGDAAIFQYNGNKRAFIILKGVRINDEIEAAYSVTGFNPVFGNRFFTRIYFQESSPICNFFASIITDSSRKLNFRYFGKAPAPLVTTAGNQKIFRWSNPDIQSVATDPSTPSWFTANPYVSVTEFNNWKEVVDWGMGIFNHYKFDLPAGLQKRMADWKSMATDDMAVFIQQAIRYVQDDIRYLGLEMGVNTHQPHQPADVFASAYGDCKDKSLLLATILQREHIPAYVALVNTNTRKELIRSASTPGEFNHVIVAIEKADGYIFIDPTIPCQRGKFPDVFVPAYGYALIVREGQTALQPVQVGAGKSTLIVENLKVQFDDNSRLTVSTRFAGGSADYNRSYFKENGLNDIQRSYASYYAGIYDDLLTLGDITYEDDSSANIFTVNEGYLIPSIWKEDVLEKRKHFAIYAKSIMLELPDPPNTGIDHLPVALNFPSTVQYVLKVEMPRDWKYPVGNLHIKNDSYQFDFETEVMGNLITFRYKVQTFKDHIPVGEIDQYRRDYKKMNGLANCTFSYTETAPPIPAKKKSKDWATLWLMGLVIVPLGFVFAKAHRRK
jgi:hypothetical protein